MGSELGLDWRLVRLTLVRLGLVLVRLGLVRLVLEMLVLLFGSGCTRAGGVVTILEP